MTSTSVGHGTASETCVTPSIAQSSGPDAILLGALVIKSSADFWISGDSGEECKAIVVK
eukprot:CAMPEP_0180502410 /NCGR_PEP_ID=MMETSP1036_2-20121128/45410_1 /TAXON_ID=632150 /ORGANISM="Azadinium spinosum, Strain 3D9" /LENGTH=58 /DNA_ID=CAMNT_0022511221 /DNA_START=1151 /DNA_END=1327 /DNA_ORIENTATION=+